MSLSHYKISKYLCTPAIQPDCFLQQLATPSNCSTPYTNSLVNTCLFESVTRHRTSSANKCSHFVGTPPKRISAQLKQQCSVFSLHAIFLLFLQAFVTPGSLSSPSSILNFSHDQAMVDMPTSVLSWTCETMAPWTSITMIWPEVVPK